jgi:hypothetical protein
LPVGRRTSSSIERGERNVSLRVVERFGDAVDMAPLALLTPPDEPGTD